MATIEDIKLANPSKIIEYLIYNCESISNDCLIDEIYPILLDKVKKLEGV